MFYLSLGIAFFILLVKRYFPVLRVPCKYDLDNQKCETIIDVRDYNESCKSPIHDAVELPIAYLRRYYKEIPKDDLILIASDSREKNVGIRFLRKKGFKIVGYTLLNDIDTQLIDTQKIKATL